MMVFINTVLTFKKEKLNMTNKNELSQVSCCNFNDDNSSKNKVDRCSCGQELEFEKRRVIIDFLYLDLNVCERCRGTDNILDEALKVIDNVLDVTRVEVIINKININSEELAVMHKFISSPTIRINGIDIQMDVKESNCTSCGDLCGDKVDCRIWLYHGKEYSTAPKEMIIEALLKGIYGDKKSESIEKEYILPTNLKHFFSAMNKKRNKINKKMTLIKNISNCN
jgi:hypothetical protein